MSAYEIQLDASSNIDRLLHAESGTEVMLNRLGAELIGYRVVDQVRGITIPLMYRDSLPEKPETGWKNHATVLFPIVGGLKNKVSSLGDFSVRTPGNQAD